MSTPAYTHAPFDFGGLEKNFLLGMYRHMLQAREFEEQLYYLFLSRPMPGTTRSLSTDHCSAKRWLKSTSVPFSS